MSRRFRFLAPLALATVVTLGLPTEPASAQEPAPAEGAADPGSPVMGYITPSFFAALALFIVAKSARR